MRHTKYMKKTALAGALVLSLAVTGCGVREGEKSERNEKKMQKWEDAVCQDVNETAADTEETTAMATETSTKPTTQPEVTPTAQSSDKKDDKDKKDFSLKATFDDGELSLDQNGLNIKDKTGHVLIHDGKIDIQDKDGNFKLDNDGLVVKDETTGKDTVKISEDGLFVDDDDCHVSWDKDGFKIKSDDCDLHFNFSFGGKSKSDKNSKDSSESDDKTKKVKKSDDIFTVLDSDWTKFSHSEEWKDFKNDVSGFLSDTLPEIMDNAFDFCRNEDWRKWDKFTIINSNEVINGKSVHVKIWFDHGELKTMNLPEKNLTLKNYTLIETKEVNGDTIRTYRCK